MRLAPRLAGAKSHFSARLAPHVGQTRECFLSCGLHPPFIRHLARSRSTILPEAPRTAGNVRRRSYGNNDIPAIDGPLEVDKIKLQSGLKDTLDKLHQQIVEGQNILATPVNTWKENRELYSERSIWADYTSQVLEVLFDSPDRAHNFRVAAKLFSRESGSVEDFTRDQREALQSGITYLRSLHKRLPLLVDEASKSSRKKRGATKETSSDDPQIQMTIGLLEKVNPELANAYRQVRRDLQDVTRLSYRGTANELREILREVLVKLAPDSEVVARPWFVHTVAEQSLEVVEEGLSKLVRGIYSRTLVASHTGQDLEEIRKQVRYFDPLINDLCD